MPIDADIPSWYYTLNVADGEPLDVAVMCLVNSVTIMAYRNNMAAVLSVAAAEMAYANAIGRSAWIGINIAPPGANPASTSYYGQPGPAIDRDMAALNTEARRCQPSLDWRCVTPKALQSSINRPTSKR